MAEEKQTKTEDKNVDEAKEKQKEINKALSKQEAPKVKPKVSQTPLKDDPSNQQQAKDSTDSKKDSTDKKDDKPKKEKPAEKPQHPGKQEAVANAQNMPASLKHSKYIGAFIKNKTIDKAIEELEQVIKLKKAVPYKGEIPHRKGKGMMSGRYPVKASKLFIALLKGLKGNAIQNQMELEKTTITLVSPSWARRPARRKSRQGKRVNMIIKATQTSSSKKETKQETKKETKQVNSSKADSKGDNK
jgi:ribosomal protein L22